MEFLPSYEVVLVLYVTQVHDEVPAEVVKGNDEERKSLLEVGRLAVGLRIGDIEPHLQLFEIKLKAEESPLFQLSHELSLQLVELIP